MELEPYLKLNEVAEILSVTESQVYAMVRDGSLKAMKVGAKGHWRVGHKDLEAYVAEAYKQTAEFVKANPLVAREDANEV